MLDFEKAKTDIIGSVTDYPNNRYVYIEPLLQNLKDASYDETIAVFSAAKDGLLEKLDLDVASLTNQLAKVQRIENGEELLNKPSNEPQVPYLSPPVNSITVGSGRVYHTFDDEIRRAEQIWKEKVDLKWGALLQRTAQDVVRSKCTPSNAAEGWTSEVFEALETELSDIKKELNAGAMARIERIRSEYDKRPRIPDSGSHVY